MNYQQEFTPTESAAICEMIAKLVAEDYNVLFWLDMPVTVPDEGITYTPYAVEVRENSDDGIVVSTGKAYRLLDALTDAWQSTPERRLSKPC